jgi:hypothetical protein
MQKGKVETVVAILGVLIAAIALIPAFGQWLFPQDSLNHQPPKSTPTPGPSVSSLNTRQPQSGNQITIDWGVLDEHFDISNVQFGRQAIQNPLGQFEEFDTLSFMVETRSDFLMTAFFARFYDSEGVEVDMFMPVRFEPEYTQWYAGQRSRAIVILPSNIPKVTEIRFSGL